VGEASAFTGDGDEEGNPRPRLLGRLDVAVLATAVEEGELRDELRLVVVPLPAAARAALLLELLAAASGVPALEVLRRRVGKPPAMISFFSRFNQQSN
jgi:hypothetical protein